MPVRLTCPGCRAALAVKDEFAHRAARCPRCQTVIPAAPPGPDPGPDAAPPAPPAPPTTGWGEREPRGPRPDERADRRRSPERPRERPRGDRRPGPKLTSIPTLLLVLGLPVLAAAGLATVAALKLVEVAIPWVGERREQARKDDEQRAWDEARAAKQAEDQADRAADAAAPAAANAPPGPLATAAAGLTPGLTRPQVEAVLGGRPKVYVPAEDWAHFDQYPVWTARQFWGPKAAAGRVLWWRGDGEDVLAVFHPTAGPAGRLQGTAVFRRGARAPVGGVGDHVPDDAAFTRRHGPGETPTVPLAELLRAFGPTPDHPAMARYQAGEVVLDAAVLWVRPPVTEHRGRVGSEVCLVTDPARIRDKNPPQVVCQVETAENAKAVALSPGQTVKLRVRCGQWVYGGGVYLGDGRVESAGPDPAVAVTAAALAADLKADPAGGKYKGKVVTVTGLAAHKDDRGMQFAPHGTGNPVVWAVLLNTPEGVVLDTKTRVTVKGRVADSPVAAGMLWLEGGWSYPP